MSEKFIIVKIRFKIQNLKKKPHDNVFPNKIYYELSLVSLILYGKLSGGRDSRGTLAENVWRKILPFTIFHFLKLKYSIVMRRQS